MNWLEALNRAVEYLELHITEKVDIKEVSKIALSSPYHFQRMYHVVTGITVAEYVRRRRLTLAAQDILAGEKIIEVAFKYGYETPEAFTKAFGRLHGLSPTAARESGARLKAYPKLSFQISIKGEAEMHYEIVEKEGFTVFGKATSITMEDGENFKQVPAFWQACEQDGSCAWICQQSQGESILGICKDFDNEKNEFQYMIGAKGSLDSLPEGYISYQVPTATWAVFESVGALPEAIQELTRRIFSEWLPATGYQHDCAPELEVYPPGNPQDPAYCCQIWIPIKK